jgi:hypothetical protein
MAAPTDPAYAAENALRARLAADLRQALMAA